MKKISITGIDARNKAFKGLEYVAESILSTVGPYGLNFLLEKGRRITNDGYSISAELCGTLEDEFERLAAEVAHEASAKTNDMVGDATSTAWGLNYCIVKEAQKYLPTKTSLKSKKNQAEIAKLIRKDKDYVISELSKMAKPIESKEELIKSALVSVEDESVAELLGNMQWELGPEGVIIAEEVNDSECSIEKVRGIRIDSGFGASHLINNPEKQSLEVSNIHILLTNHTIGVEELQLLKKNVFTQLIAQKRYGIVIMARGFTSEAIKLCQESAAAGFAIFPINAPYTNQAEVLRDIEAVTGGRYIDSEEGSLEDVYISDVGFAKTLSARYMDGIIAGEDNDTSRERVKARAEILRKKLIGSQSDFEKRLIETRIAQLENGFAILKVGSRSVHNRKRLKDKCDDAVNSVRLALKGGTVKGGGLAFKEISDGMEVGSFLKEPIKCVYNAIMLSAPDDFVIEDWVRDPYITLKTALENACDFDIPFISINGIITTKDKKECKCDEQ